MPLALEPLPPGKYELRVSTLFLFEWRRDPVEEGVFLGPTGEDWLAARPCNLVVSSDPSLVEAFEAGLAARLEDPRTVFFAAFVADKFRIRAVVPGLIARLDSDDLEEAELAADALARVAPDAEDLPPVFGRAVERALAAPRSGGDFFEDPAWRLLKRLIGLACRRRNVDLRESVLAIAHAGPRFQHGANSPHDGAWCALEFMTRTPGDLREPLLEAIDDADEHVALCALETLARLLPEDAYPRLLATAREGGSLSGFAKRVRREKFADRPEVQPYLGD